MDRRFLLQTVAVPTALLCFGQQAPAQAAPVPPASATKPNIVVMIADDLTYHDLGCWGNKDVKTPNLDRLAAQGMRLTRCYTPAPVCSPTRQALYTGLFPVKSGAYPNHAIVRPGIKSLPHYLQPLGYRVGLVGKTHFGPPQSFPFEYPQRRQMRRKRRMKTTKLRWITGPQSSSLSVIKVSPTVWSWRPMSRTAHGIRAMRAFTNHPNSNWRPIWLILR
jgi:arylsulfatase A-like enzyme